MPCVTSRSSNSERSRPAEKCSPSPAISTAPMPSGNDVEELLNSDNGLIVERIALLRPVKSQNGDRALALRNEGRRKPDCKTLRHYSTS